ncbi:MAG: hypothetical protein ACKPKO_23015 [Candidatus Fonsibacter sp.]
MDLKLTTDNNKAINYVSKTQFKNAKLIDGLFFIEFYKQEIEYICRLFYIGFIKIEDA